MARKLPLFFRGADGERYRVLGANNEPMVTSEAFTRRADAKRGRADLTKRVLQLATNRELLEELLARTNLGLGRSIRRVLEGDGNLLNETRERG
jgi:hypothetical protein